MASCAPPQVLVVDDEGIWRELLQSSLERLGATVCSVKDLDSGQREVERRNFDLVVTDLAFPSHRGAGFLDFTMEGFAQAVAARHLPLVVVSNLLNLEFACKIASTQHLVGLLPKEGLTKGDFAEFIKGRFAWARTGDPSRRVTWLHVSDFHFGSEANSGFNRSIVEKAFLADIERFASDIDIVFVTGDVANSGRREQYVDAKRFFVLLRRRLKASVCVYVVPGNHDKDRSKVADALRRLGVGSRDDAMEILGNGPMMLAATQPFAEYVKFARTLMGPDVKLREDLGFAHLDVNTGIAVYGLNSALASDHTRGGRGEVTVDHGNLFVGEESVQAGFDSLEGKDSILSATLMHHPLAHLADFDKTDLENALVQKDSLLLHGHLHRADFTYFNGLRGRLTVVPAGSLYEARESINSYNVGRIDLDNDTLTVTYRRYSDLQRKFIKDIDTTGEEFDGEFRVPFSTPATSFPR